MRFVKNPLERAVDASPAKKRTFNGTVLIVNTHVDGTAPMAEQVAA